MTVKRVLGLRNNAHRVDVVTPNGTTRPVLGRAHPDDDEVQRRARVQQQWDEHRPAPRPPRLATIDEPLPQRTQTILSYQVGPELRRRLNGGMTAIAASRMPVDPVEQADLLPPDAEQ